MFTVLWAHQSVKFLISVLLITAMISKNTFDMILKVSIVLLLLVLITSNEKNFHVQALKQSLM